MEVKVIITPSPEMVSLVKSVMAVFSANNLVDKVQKMQEFSAQQKQPGFESGGTVEKEVITGPSDEEVTQAITRQVEEVTIPKKRKTKAEIEAEKTSLIEKSEATEEAAEQVALEEVSTEKVAPVEVLRKMTMNRSGLIGNVPAKLLEFGYSSVTSLAKDAEANKKYHSYLLSVKPFSVEDNA